MQRLYGYRFLRASASAIQSWKVSLHHLILQSAPILVLEMAAEEVVAVAASEGD
jgi:hypothetical protein